MFYKLSFKNFGPIKEGTVSLSPFTVFVGPNNTGKTYASYAFYCISLICKRSIQEVISSLGFDFYRTKIIEPLFRSSSRSYSFSLESIGKEIFRSYEQDIKEFFKNFHSLFLNENTPLFKNSEVLLTNFDKIKEKFLDNIKKEKYVDKDITWWTMENFPEISVKKAKGDWSIAFYLKTKQRKPRKNSFKEEGVITSIEECLTSFFINVWRQTFEKVFFLPAERIGLIIAYLDILGIVVDKSFLLTLIEETDYDSSFYQDQEQKIYPEHLRDFLRFLFLYHKRKITDNFQEAVELLEKEVIKGKVGIKEIKGFKPHGFFYQFQASTDSEDSEFKEIKLSSASSGVKSITPLILYLKVASKNSLLFIDEPEMNLHPAAQDKLVQSLCMAVNKGLNIVIATHTPYIVDSINILLKLYRLKEKKPEKVKELCAEWNIPESAIINPEKVSAYLFTEDGKIENLKQDDGFLNWDTFSDVSFDMETKNDVIDDLIL